MKQRVLKVLLVVLILGAAITAAFWGGAEVGNYIDKSKKDEFFSKRQQRTEGILKKMGTIAEGEILSDYNFFETLDSKQVTLSELIHENTWLMFAESNCVACLEEMERIKEHLTSEKAGIPIIIISHSYPLDLIDLRNEMGLKIPILHDRNSTYIDSIGIYTYPFNILVDNDLRIKKIASQLIKEDLE